MHNLSVSTINAFCRKYDLIFVEMGSQNKEEVLHFLDFNHSRRVFTPKEITEKLEDYSPKSDIH